MNEILVVGATGNVGRHLVRQLLDAGMPVRATTTARVGEDGSAGAASAAVAPSAAASAAEPGLRTVPFDFTEPTTWADAFAGVRQMFLLRPPHLSRPKRDMIPALERARELGVEQVVFLSVQGAEKNPVVPHAVVERWLRDSGLSWTFLRASFFMQNLTGPMGPDIRERSQLMVPAGTGATAFVDAADVAAVAAAALLDPAGSHHRAWTPTGPEALTYEQVGNLLSEELGRPISYVRPGILRYARQARRELGMPLPMVAVTSVIYTTARLGLAAGLTDDVRQVTGRPPVDLRAFLAREHRDGALR